jgi:transposase-like protein
LSQHFLLSGAARTLSLARIMRMPDDEARDTFKRIRWGTTNGEPFCPHCGCLTIYTLAETPPRWKCSGCRRKFSLTSGTLFHSRKLPVRDYLAIIALSVNGVKSTSPLQISRDLNINPKSSFVLLHKLREAMGLQVHNPDEPELSGEVQVDGAYFGGHVKPENRKADRKDRRLAEEQTGKRQVVVVAREVRGRTRPFVVLRESEAVPLIRKHVASGAIIHADESNAWERLHASYDVRRVNHSVEYKAEDGANVNQAESYFSRLRRAEIGQHHRISGSLLHQYANEGTKRLGERTTVASRTARIGIRSSAPRSPAAKVRYGPATGTGAQHERQQGSRRIRVDRETA